MTYPNPLLEHVHSRFREVFGEPDSVLQHDSQWSLRCAPEAPAIFVLVNGSYEKPAVWVFDPYSQENVWRASTTSIADAEAAIVLIQGRVEAAKDSWRSRKA